MTAGLIAGRYRIERVLGQGATATVHFARDTEKGTAVAIKILRPELAKSRATERFLKEIRRTSQLQHPHILQVLDSGEYEGRPFFVLPYMEGGTLRRRLGKSNQLPFEETISILRTVAGALDYAHQKGLVHRDIKPENILFTNGQACVGDFGIARVLEAVYGTDGSTSTDTIRGTYAYMSPEQAAGSRDIDGRSDIYSLACVAYEMITGMQAFIGPTPEAVVAQRFAFTPREIRAYRPSAPASVDAALAKAFAMSPADRYRTSSDFITALEAAVGDVTPVPIVEVTTSEWSGQQGQGRPLWASIIGIAIVSGLWLIFAPDARQGVTERVGVDTTRMVLLPLERDTADAPPWHDDDLLHQAVARYRDISVLDQFQVSDALRRGGTISQTSDAARLAASFGAGRFVRGRVSRFGLQWRVTASLYDAPGGNALYQAVENVPPDIEGATSAYARLADALLLRGVTIDSTPSQIARPKSLAALQAFGRAHVALGEWDLTRADSVLQAVVGYDPDHARAHFLLAQVRAWRGQNPNAWRTAAERATTITGQLDDREARLARALVHLSRAEYEPACAIYRSLATRNDRDFAAWFGLGQCRMMNRTVVPDAKSPSGWRYQMSAHQAMNAYSRAFEILPSVYRGYERGAFQRLQALLLITTNMHVGYARADSAVFYGRPGWMGDTLVLVPYPVAQMVKGGPVPPGYDKALAIRRAEFKRLALHWSFAYPASPGAKEAVALSLERLGDPTAIDTIRAARRLAQDDVFRTHLAATEVLFLVRFGIADRPDMLNRARTLGDSLLASAGRSRENAEALIPVAALLGRCERADALISQAGMESAARAFSAGLYVEAQKVLVRLTLGCPAPSGGMSLQQLAAAIDREAAARPAADRPVFDGWLLLRPAIQTGAYDDAILARLASSTAYPQVIAARHAIRGDASNAVTVLEKAESTWVRPPTPDIALATTRVWLTIGDTARAARVLDVMVEAARAYEPNLFFYDAGTASAFIAGLIIRADLAAARRDVPTRRRWSSAVMQLWADADKPLRPVLHRMSQYASTR